MKMTTPNRPPTRPTNRTAPPPPPAQTRASVQFGKITSGAGHRTVLYGPGGIGKTTLATQAPGPVAFIDLDDSLPRLASQLDTDNLMPVSGVEDWGTLRIAINADGWDDIKTLVIDTGTRAEELAIAHTLATVPHEKGHLCARLEDYGFGKGYTHVYDTFLPLLGDLDRHSRQGRNVVIICHDCTSTVPNPAGEDWLRYEPRLQAPNSGKASIRLRVREWADHVLFLGYDVDVGKDGKGRGAGTRTIYPAELPHCMAKSRTTQTPVPMVHGEGRDFWASILT
jgi:GTPase SAR1 family protein